MVVKITLRKIHGTLIPYSTEDMERLNRLSDALYSVDLKNMDIRTAKQNAAIHVWCEKIAKTLNGAGLYMTGIFGNDIMWTMELVKTQIVKSLIKSMFDIDSTTKLKRKELDQLIDTITLIFGEKKGIVIPPFPNRKLWDEEKLKNS